MAENTARGLRLLLRFLYFYVPFFGSKRPGIPFLGIFPNSNIILLPEYLRIMTFRHKKYPRIILNVLIPGGPNIIYLVRTWCQVQYILTLSGRSWSMYDIDHLDHQILTSRNDMLCRICALL